VGTHASGSQHLTEPADTNRLTLHGARGSHPVSGQPYARYGGSTSCFSLETRQGLLVIDAGTGIASLARMLHQRSDLPPVTLLLTHLHLDHLIGLPAFTPLTRRDARVTLMADPAIVGDWRRALKTLIGSPLWPVDLVELGASIQFEDLPDGTLERYGVIITRCVAWHPQGCVSYRLQTPERAIVIATDREHGEASHDRALLALCRGAEVLLHDAQYTPEEYANRRGWGHSTWEQGTRIARESGVKRLVLVSHDPNRSDGEIDRIVEQARRTFPDTVGGAEGMVV
jgi:ribonuclease BN (tRNA processing enzyme)